MLESAEIVCNNYLPFQALGVEKGSIAILIAKAGKLFGILDIHKVSSLQITTQERMLQSTEDVQTIKAEHVAKLSQLKEQHREELYMMQVSEEKISQEMHQFCAMYLLLCKYCPLQISSGDGHSLPPGFTSFRHSSDCAGKASEDTEGAESETGFSDLEQPVVYSESDRQP